MELFKLKLPELEKGLDVSETSCFRRVEVQEHLSLLPCYIGRLADGIIEHLNGKMLRYVSSYGGVLVSYSKPVVLQSYGKIFDEQPHIHFDIRYTAYLFKPTVNSILCGTVNKIGGDHMGCLVYDCFNASLIAPPPTPKNGYNVAFGRNFQIGSKVWFTVTRLDVIGGILSITGEHMDFDGTLGLDPGIETQSERTPSNPCGRKRKRDCNSSRNEPDAAGTSVISDEAQETDQIQDHPKKRKRKKHRERRLSEEVCPEDEARERRKPRRKTKHTSGDLEDEVIHKRKKHKLKHN